jgi:hypothetical protein
VHWETPPRSYRQRHRGRHRTSESTNEAPNIKSRPVTGNIVNSISPPCDVASKFVTCGVSPFSENALVVVVVVIKGRHIQACSAVEQVVQVLLEALGLLPDELFG